jgi:NADPH:quinone reductase-like Zn-dependent oxidoreductase
MRQKDVPLSFPAILGRDVSGVVRAVCPNVKHFKPGDRVLALSNATYAELVAVGDSDVTHLPDGVDLTDAAAIPLIALTGDLTPLPIWVRLILYELRLLSSPSVV